MPHIWRSGCAALALVAGCMNPAPDNWGQAGATADGGSGARAGGVSAGAAAGAGARDRGSSAAPAGQAGSASVAGAGRAGSGAAGQPAASDADGGVGEPQEPSAGAADSDAVVQPQGTGPGDWRAGDYPPELDSQSYLELSAVAGQGQYTRQYKVHVPPGYDPAVPMPVVFCIHGLGQDAVMFCVHGADMPAKSDAAGFILVMPNGYQNSWNGGTCCGAAADEQLDDVALMRAIYAEVSKHLNLDSTRVYATGLSNGAYMSYRLACEASDLFVAVAPGAGAVGMNDIGGGTRSDGDLAACAPTHPISVLDLHGTEDPLIDYTLQKPSLERIAKADGCQLTTQPAEAPASAGDVSCVSYAGCPAHVTVTGCSVAGGGHVWFGNDTCGTGVDGGCVFVGNNSDTLKSTDAVWEFFAAHARAAASKPTP